MVLCIAFAALAGRPLAAAEIVVTRTSRAVTAAESAGGAPADGFVHDFYVTSTADLLVVDAAVTFPVYNHRYGTNYSAPESELVAEFPALGADSFLRLPSETVLLGGGFNGTSGAWGDFADDGPQKNFLFGRLTTSQEAVFAGNFHLRGEHDPVLLPFSLTLSGEASRMTETLTVTREEPRGTAPTESLGQGTLVFPAPEPRFPQIVPTFPSPPIADFRAALERKYGDLTKFKPTGTLPVVPKSAWPLPLPTRGSQSLATQAPEPTGSLLLLGSLFAILSETRRRARQRPEGAMHNGKLLSRRRAVSDF